MLHFDSDEYMGMDKRADKSLPPLITVFSAANYCDVHGNLVSCMCTRACVLPPSPLAGSQLIPDGV